MNRIGLDYITMIGVSPLHFIRTAAAAGCRYVGLFPEQTAAVPHGHPHFSLIDDAALRRDTVSCLNDNGISIALFDSFAVHPGQSVERYRRRFDAIVEMGARRVNTVSFVDWDRTVEEVAKLVAMAAEYGVTVTVESCPVLTIKTLAQALELIRTVAMPNFKLLIDTMHVSRTRETALLATLDPMLVDYVQISDGPLAMPGDREYMEEAMYERQVPGDGEMPLVEILRHIRPDVVISGEVPLRSLREAGVDDLGRSRLIVDGTRRVLAEAEGNIVAA